MFIWRKPKEQPWYDYYEVYCGCDGRNNRRIQVTGVLGKRSEINHYDVPMPVIGRGICSRGLVSNDQGAESA